MASTSTKTKRKKVSTKKTVKKGARKTPASPRSLSKSEASKNLKRQPLGHLMAEQLLQKAGFKGTVSSDSEILDEYSTDESIFSIRPQIVLQPKDQQDVEVAVKVLVKETEKFPSLSLTPRAAGTGLSGGSLTDSIVMDVVTSMNKIGEVKERGNKITITCEPGAMWKDVEKKLKEYDSYLAPFPASKDLCSIGGSVANNCAGPDSLKFGHMVEWIEELDITLSDGKTYNITPLTYKEFTQLTKKKNNKLAEIALEIFKLIEANESAIKKAEPKTKKNTSGYALWDVIDTSVKDFKKGKGTFNLIRVIAGSQGTLGIITSITMRARKIDHNSSLIAVPVFDLSDAGKVVEAALKYDPTNVEVFDGLSFDLSLKHPELFKKRLGPAEFYKVMFALYTTYHIRYMRKTPEFTLLITTTEEDMQKVKEMLNDIRANGGKKARLVVNQYDREMFWQIRRASYPLSKMEDPNKRPAPFLEDMTVPPKNLGPFFTEIKRLLKEYNLIAAVHGHGGNGHFHFYPLIDFTNKATPRLIKKLSDEFFDVAIKYEGNICGEHNDGIIRTPYLNKMYSKKILQLFEETEAIFDPTDIFNPGKKVNPRFEFKDVIRTKN